MPKETPTTEELQARIPSLADKAQAYRDRMAARKGEVHQPALGLELKFK